MSKNVITADLNDSMQDAMKNSGLGSVGTKRAKNGQKFGSGLIISAS